MTPVVVPEGLLQGGDPGSVANWFFDEGSTVRADDLLCEIMTEKVANEIRAPVAGILRILAPTETIVKSGDTLAVIESSD
jgi:pyruvate/2-oxoglutarate dehydrogenase complex dihydrolipoamide acyltransferase (E2) component